MAVTQDELKTILSFGVHLAKLDGDFNVWERKLLAHFADAMQLSEADKQQLMSEKFSLGSGLRRLGSDEAQVFLVKTLCAVAFVDGDTSPVEVEFIERVVSQLSAQVFLLGRAEWGKYVEEVNAQIEAL